MPRVTKEMMKALIDAGIMPPRHKLGCPKNYLRTLPLIYLASGKTHEQIKVRMQEEDACLPCTCEE